MYDLPFSKSRTSLDFALMISHGQHWSVEFVIEKLRTIKMEFFYQNSLKIKSFSETFGGKAENKENLEF